MGLGKVISGHDGCFGKVLGCLKGVWKSLKFGGFLKVLRGLDIIGHFSEFSSNVKAFLGACYSC